MNKPKKFDFIKEVMMAPKTKLEIEYDQKLFELLTKQSSILMKAK